jgi:hypothetical protein
MIVLDPETIGSRISRFENPVPFRNLGASTGPSAAGNSAVLQSTPQGKHSQPVLADNHTATTKEQHYNVQLRPLTKQAPST